LPSKAGERDLFLLHRTVRKPRGHYTARLLTRLPIVRFRRCIINRRRPKRLHPNVTIYGQVTAIQIDQGIEGMAMPESGR
jgi:hypothetical protein